MLLQVFCLYLLLDGSIILSAGGDEMTTFVDSKVNVTTLPHLKKLDCCNYFLKGISTLQ